MNKYLTLFFSFFLIQLGYTQIQSGKVVYRIVPPDVEELLGVNGDNADNDATRQVMTPYYEGVIKIIPELKLELHFDFKESSMTVEKPMLIDNQVNSLDLALSFSGIYGMAYSNLEENIFMLQKEKKIVTSDFNMLDWEIHEQTKEIQGYQCIKATTTLVTAHMDIPIVAWFTPELPFPFGPQEVRGLPGLILEMKYRDIYTYYTESLDLYFKPQKINRPSKGEVVSWEEEIISEIKNYRKYMGSRGVKENDIITRQDKIIEKYTPKN